jgi:glutamate-5-semialdehyde dehydrogenase
MTAERREDEIDRTDTTDMATRARAARRAGHALAQLDSAARAALLHALASALERPDRTAAILAANVFDLEHARAAAARGRLAPSLVARLVLDAGKLAALADGVRQLAEMPEQIGVATLRRELDEDLVLERITCPLGLLGVVFEARPDAVVQITALACKSGNAALLKGGSEALHSNRALVDLHHAVLREHGLDVACVGLLEDRAAFHELLGCHEEVDLIIARGSGSFVAQVMAATKIPVLGHAEGLCHLYLHADADPQQAAAIAVDAKCSYPAACNSIETLLWHADATEAARACLLALVERGVELRGDAATLALAATLGVTVTPAQPSDWDTEYGDLILSVRGCSSLDDALAHIEQHGSMHTEAIICTDAAIGEAFVRHVDAACVFVNASTRFADGYRFGLGAEVGISTGKLHARGPVGVEGLLSHRWVLRGRGQVASDYGPGKRAFRHRDLA